MAEKGYKWNSLQGDIHNIGICICFCNLYCQDLELDHLYNFKDFKLNQLDKGPDTLVLVTKDEALSLYKNMQTIRRLETKVGNLYMQKAIRGFCHLYTGQEAVAVGIHSAMRPTDHAITSYRAHGWTYLMAGAGTYRIVAELLGRSGGISKGKGGSMHMFCDNFYGGHGIVGSQVPVGTGVAFTCKYGNTDAVTFIAYGDGASNQGQVHESYNIAKLWNLPCIYVCENNNFGMGTSINRSSASTTFYKHCSFIPGVWVNGMDIFAVRSASQFAIRHVNDGKGPIILEMSTYRYFGHSMSDSGTSYRKREEVQEIRKNFDPIETFKRKVNEINLITADELKKIDGEIEKGIDADVQKALDDVELPLEDLTADIYKKNVSGKVRGSSPYAWWKHNNRTPPP